MISVVIPVHNRKKFTEECLNSLQMQTFRADHIIVIDDGSTDGTRELLREKFPHVNVLRGDGNLFWTAAINLGIRKALYLGSDHVLTLNNDTVASMDFIEKMVRAAREAPDALLGAFDIDSVTRKPYYGGELINWKWSSSKFLLNLLKEDQQKGLHEVSLFPARGLLIPRRVFETIGFFEERQLPHYMADYDFTLKARRKGFKIYCNFDARIYTYPEEGGDHKIRKHKTFKNYVKHLFDIKGGGNLVNFTIYTFRNCPPQYLFPGLITGLVRRMVGFWLK
ncbi:MAG: glycosyltransferase family 2 protein [Cyclobacteriaceae bacterium]